MELVDKDQQAHGFDLADVFIEVLVKRFLIVGVAGVGLLDFSCVGHVQGQFGHQLHVETFLVLQLATLERVLDFLAVALVEYGFGVPADEDENPAVVLSLLLLHRLQKHDLVRVLIDWVDMEQLADQEIADSSLPHGVFVLLQVEVLPGRLLYARVVAF